jgi:hypothetical protein
MAAVEHIPAGQERVVCVAGARGTVWRIHDDADAEAKGGETRPIRKYEGAWQQPEARAVEPSINMHSEYPVSGGVIGGLRT